MDKKYNYIYITTNLINGKQYIGDHSTNDINDEKSIKYLGSGSLLKKKLIQYGRKNFKKEILEIFETRIESYENQEKYIIKYNTLVPNGYNISPKGGLHKHGGHSKESIEKIKCGGRGKKRSAETKEKYDYQNLI